MPRKPKLSTTQLQCKQHAENLNWQVTVEETGVVYCPAGGDIKFFVTGTGDLMTVFILGKVKRMPGIRKALQYKVEGWLKTMSIWHEAHPA